MVFAGGFVGTLGRLGVIEALPTRHGTWPWATFVVNVVGTAVLGTTVAMLHERPAAVRAHPFLATGVCGALTTFSTMQLEVLDLFDHDRVGLALAYVLISVAAGLAAVAIATKAVHRARARA